MGSSTEQDMGALTVVAKALRLGVNSVGGAGGNAAVALTGTGGTSTGTMTTTTALVTTAALTTAAAGSHVATITYTGIAAGDLAFASLVGGTNTTIGLSVKAVCTTNTITVTIMNNNAGAVNGTISFALLVLKA